MKTSRVSILAFDKGGRDPMTLSEPHIGMGTSANGPLS